MNINPANTIASDWVAGHGCCTDCGWHSEDSSALGLGFRHGEETHHEVIVEETRRYAINYREEET